ncbi:hypothetical protein NP493_765g00012 [Ridgeia piscesae]|uniref:DNA-repair protein Xrcc1 N-terminal domain-containing protein n=1 Tax=Ridgeia piscesae TaxID=27915 RepID=A0AAD9KPG5_RIDPI|nr:hypothetical protein NP493_765g00012 [Ridgeia piscesae]
MQDKKHCAENLLKGALFGKWLSSSEDRTGQLDGEFQLERACHISGIDIGTQWAFSVSVSVGRSSWPRGKDYVTLIPSVIFMTPKDCKQGKGRDTVRMFKQEDFSTEARDEAWDRLKITCCQPFRKDVQFGVSMLQIWSVNPFDATSSDTDQGLHVKPSVSHQETSPSTQPTNQAVSEIQSRLLGSTPSSKRKMTGLQARLEKIDASTENGPSQGRDMSRNARLVLAAAAKVPRYALPPEANQQSSVRTPKKQISFEESAKQFFANIDVKDLDPEHMTFADLRHKFEKIKLRKLSHDEKKIFFALARNVIEDIFDVGQGLNKPLLSPDGSTQHKKKKIKPSTAAMKYCRDEKSSRLNPTVRDDVEITGFTPSSPKWASPNTGKRRRMWDMSHKHTAAVNQNVPVNQMTAVNQTAAVNRVGPGTSPVTVSPPRFRGRSRPVATTTWGSRGEGNVLGRGGEVGNRRKGKNTASGIESSSCLQITRHRDPPKEKFMACPLCEGSFIETLIEAHAAQCQMHQPAIATALRNRQREHAQLTSSGESYNYDDYMVTSGGGNVNSAEESECPICGISFPLDLLPLHADSCADFIL